MRVACAWLAAPTDVSPIAESFLRLSPQVTVRADRAIFAEIGKCRRLYSEASFRARAGALLRRFGTRAQLGIGDGIAHALVFARWGEKPLSALPLGALRDYADPFGQADARPIENMIAALSSLGVRDLEDFLRLPSSRLPSRFGEAGLLCRARASGASDAPWPHWAPEESIVEAQELAHEDLCGALEPLLFYSRGLLERVFARLRGRGKRLASLGLGLALERFSTVRRPERSWVFRFLLPHGSTQAVLPVIRERLARDLERQPLESLVLRIRYEALETTPGYDSQRHLFHSRDEQEERFDAAVEHLSEGLGRERVFRAVTTEARLPERSWKKRAGSGPNPGLAGIVPTRPTRLLPVPRRIRITRGKVFLDSRVFTILGGSPDGSGLERISADWLDGLQARDYFRMEVEDGPPLWIFQDPRDGLYYLHGYFE